MNILFVDDFNVFNPHFSGEQRSNLLLRACCSVAQTDVCLFKKYGEKENIENCRLVYEKHFDMRVNGSDRKKMRKSFGRDAFCPVNKDAEEIIGNLVSAKNYDVIVVRYLFNALRWGLLKYSDRLVIDIDDNPVTRIKNEYVLLKSTTWKEAVDRLLVKFKLPFLKHAYSSIIKNVRAAFASNEKDLCVNKDKCVLLPNVSFTENKSGFCDFAVTPKRLLFVGQIAWQPNYDGLKRFFNRIYPLVLERIPDLEVSVAGNYSNWDVSEWQNLKGVQVKGFVKDLESEYENCRAAIVPVWAGAGTNIKVLEAMRMKRPCVTSLHGSRGYDRYFEKNKDYLVCRPDGEFAQAVVSMLEDENKNHEIASNGYNKVCEHFSVENFMRIASGVLAGKNK